MSFIKTEICPKCRKETPDNQPKCINCGANLAGATQLPPGYKQQKPGIPSPGRDARKIPAGADAKGKTQVVPGGSQKNPIPAPPPSGQQKPPASGKSEDIQPDTELELLRKTLAGRYEITRKLGSGGMANVYHAREIALKREVAIKVLPRSFLRDEQFDFVRTADVEVGCSAGDQYDNLVRP